MKLSSLASFLNYLKMDTDTSKTETLHLLWIFSVFHLVSQPKQMINVLTF